MHERVGEERGATAEMMGTGSYVDEDANGCEDMDAHDVHGNGHESVNEKDFAEGHLLVETALGHQRLGLSLVRLSPSPFRALSLSPFPEPRSG